MKHFGKIIIVFDYFCKKLHRKSLRGFRMCRVLNMSEFWISANVCKYDRDAIMEEFWILQNFEYAIPFWHFEWKIEKKDAYRVLFSTSGHFSKREGKDSPLPSSSAPVRVAKYASISLNMSKYPWKYLNELFSLSQDSQYAWSYYMFDRVLKMPRILNKPGFWIWYGCICKGY